jgi:hypothetical protein
MIHEISVTHPIGVPFSFLSEHGKEISSCALKAISFIVFLDRAFSYLK